MGELFQEQLEALRARSLERKLREISSAQGPEVQIAGRRLINFSSNDYLGLASDSRLREAAIGTIREFGVGTGASRLVSGTQSPHLRLEDALAKWKETEAALSFSSGYAAALGTVPALVSKDDVILLDKLCHASLIDGAKLSGARSLIEWLINRARSFIYSTAPPPAIVAAALAAVNFLGSSEGEERRRLLWERIGLMQDLLPRNELNEKAGVANSAIFPWIVGDEQAAIDLASALQTEGFLVPAIRYPTVAKGSARLRITVTALHAENQIRSLCKAIRKMTKLE